MNQPSFKVAGTIAGVKTSKASFSGPANGVTIGVVGAIEKGSTYDLFRHRCNILPPSSATHTCLRSTEHGNCTWYTVLHSEYFHIFTLCAHCTHRRDMKRAWFGMNDNHKVFEKKIYSDGFLKPKFVSYVEAMKPNVQDKFKATYPGGEKDIMLSCGDTELTDAQCVDMFHGQNHMQQRPTPPGAYGVRRIHVAARQACWVCAWSSIRRHAQTGVKARHLSGTTKAGVESSSRTTVAPTA